MQIIKSIKGWICCQGQEQEQGQDRKQIKQENMRLLFGTNMTNLIEQPQYFSGIQSQSKDNKVKQDTILLDDTTINSTIYKQDDQSDGSPPLQNNILQNQSIRQLSIREPQLQHIKKISINNLNNMGLPQADSLKHVIHFMDTNAMGEKIKQTHMVPVSSLGTYRSPFSSSLYAYLDASDPKNIRMINIQYLATHSSYAGDTDKSIVLRLHSILDPFYVDHTRNNLHLFKHTIKNVAVNTFVLDKNFQVQVLKSKINKPRDYLICLHPSDKNDVACYSYPGPQLNNKDIMCTTNDIHLVKSTFTLNLLDLKNNIIKDTNQNFNIAKDAKNNPNLENNPFFTMNKNEITINAFNIILPFDQKENANVYFNFKNIMPDEINQKVYDIGANSQI